MKRTFVAATLAAAALAAPAVAFAQAAAAPTPEHTVTGNMTIASDYRFRGISQTFGSGFFVPGPAIQGGIDYSHSSGIYVGNWNSNVSGNTFPNGSSIEMDFYAGWKKMFNDDFGIDIGTIYYFYPNAKYPSSFNPITGAVSYTSNTNNWEGYIGASWKWFSLKYYYAFTNYFGLDEGALNAWVGVNPNTGGQLLGNHGDTKGTQYLFGSFTYELMPKVNLIATAGYTWVRNYSALNYFDYKVGATYDWDGWILGASIIGTNADKDYWYAVNSSGTVRETGKTALVISVGKTF
jgi:uncharacterized protein (TIGR02001 family)